MHRSAFLALSVACLAVVGCSDDGGSDKPAASTVAPVTGPLEMPADGNDLQQPDPATALARLGFPQNWVLDPAAEVVGATVQYSRGESATYATFETTYALSGADPEAELEHWRTAIADALGVDVDPMSGHVTSDTGEGWMVSSVGDAQPGEPELEVEVVRLTDASRPLMVTITYKTVDREFPEVVFPASTVDPLLPSVAECYPRRIDIDLDAAADVTSPAATPVYRLWWEGECQIPTWEPAAAWANGHGFSIDPAVTNSFGNEFVLENGTSVSLNANKMDNGNMFLSIITEQPMS